MKILTFAASLRIDSFNKKLVQQVAEILRSSPGVEIDVADFKEFKMPLYDGDLEDTTGIPAGCKDFAKRVQSAQAVILSTPEYNGSISGVLKNALDWASRCDPNPFEDKPVLLLGASPGMLGSVRGLWHTRVPFEAMGSLVYPEMFGLGRAGQAFDSTGKFTDAKNTARLTDLVQSFVKFATRLSD